MDPPDLMLYGSLRTADSLPQLQQKPGSWDVVVPRAPQSAYNDADVGMEHTCLNSGSYHKASSLKPSTNPQILGHT